MTWQCTGVTYQRCSYRQNAACFGGIAMVCGATHARCGATTEERLTDSPLGRGKGRQALGWVVEQGTEQPRAARPLSLR